MSTDRICKKIPFTISYYVVVCVLLLLQFVLAEIQHCIGYICIILKIIEFYASVKLLQAKKRKVVSFNLTRPE